MNGQEGGHDSVQRTTQIYTDLEIRVRKGIF